MAEIEKLKKQLSICKEELQLKTDELEAMNKQFGQLNTEHASLLADSETQNKDSTTTYICSVCQQEHTEGEPSGMSVFLWWAIRILISLIILVSVAIGVIFFYTKYYAENQDQGGRFSQ